MTDLTALKEKRKAYINEKATEIINDMVKRGKTTDSLSTCDAPNWDKELHHAMLEIARELHSRGVQTKSSVNWGVTDWVFTIITD